MSEAATAALQHYKSINRGAFGNVPLVVAAG